MLNQVNLCGRLTADPELKVTNNDKYVTSFSLAVDRDYQSGSEKEADFINIVAWGKTAEFISKYFAKGRMMILSGRIQVRKYQTQNGENRYVTEVIANNVYFAGDKAQTPDNANFGGNNEEFTEIATGDDDLPF